MKEKLKRAREKDYGENGPFSFCIPFYFFKFIFYGNTRMIHDACSTNKLHPFSKNKETEYNLQNMR
jgi:hypothetical protein